MWREAQLTAWITSNTWDVGSYCVCLFVCSFVRSFVCLFVCFCLVACCFVYFSVVLSSRFSSFLSFFFLSFFVCLYLRNVAGISSKMFAAGSSHSSVECIVAVTS